MALADTINSHVTVTISINPPSNLSASANSSSEINLSWTDASSDETGFSIERKAGVGGTYAEIATTATGVAIYLNGDLSASTAYFYRVRAFNATSYSEYSGEASAETNAASSGGARVNTGGGGGGGGGGGDGPHAPPSALTKATFKGKAYPGSDVTLLKDAQVVAITKSDPDANFEVAIQGLSAGTYTFGVWAEDAKGNRSAAHTFANSIASGVTTLVSGIFIPPSFEIDKSEVRRGDILTFYGVSVPKARVSILVNSDEEIALHTTSSQDGTWVYKFDTDPLERGTHTARARAQKDNDITNFGHTRSFIVGSKNVEAAPPKKSPERGDLNNEGRVNLVDFSIMTYWYRKPDVPANIDLNGDGKITLVDFSIMAYYWTG